MSVLYCFLANFIRFFPYVFFLVLLIGCCPDGRIKTENVEGTVTIDGKPTADVHVSFNPKIRGVGETAGGYSSGNGKYTISSVRGHAGKGALPGEYVVTLSRSVERALKKPVPDMGSSDGGMITTELVESLPAVYQDKHNSPITVTVKKGKNQIDINIETK